MALYQVAELVPAGCWKEIPDDLSLPHRLGGQVGGPRQSPMRKERGRDFYYDVVDWVSETVWNELAGAGFRIRSL